MLHIREIPQGVVNMWVAVCDDDEYFLDDLKNAVYTYSNAHRLEIAIDGYSSGEDLLASKSNYDMVFLDYKMEGIDGLETAKTLRRKNPNCVINFMTSYPSFIYESFEVRTFRFFDKPLDNEKLYRALDSYYKGVGADSPLLIKVDRDTVIVRINDIVYLEASGKKCFINLVGNSLHCAKTMAAVARSLPQNIFFKVSKANIINFNYFSKHDNRTVHLQDGSTVPVSRRYLAPFKNALRLYVKSQAI